MKYNKDYEKNIRILGDLAGDPVYHLYLDSVNHPEREKERIQLNSSTVWLGWRGEWRTRGRNFSLLLLAIEVNEPDPDATSIWKECTYIP